MDGATSTESSLAYDVAEIMGALYGRGFAGLQGAFRASGRQMWRRTSPSVRGRARPARGAVGRGPKRYYVEIQPEKLRGFVELVTHPWVRSVCEAVLGAGYRSSRWGSTFPARAR